MAVVATDLRALTRGEILEPHDEGYEAARAAFNALATGRPIYIFRPADERDVVAAEGFACDALIGARLVTVDGDVLDVDEQHEPELLWGLRGGGGNFGIVTHLRYALASVGRMYGGALRFRGDGIRDVILRTLEI